MPNLFDSFRSAPSKGTKPTAAARPSSGGSLFDSFRSSSAAGGVVAPKGGQIPGEVDPTDIAKAQKGIDNHLSKILESDAPAGEKKKAKDKSIGKQAKSLFGKILSAVDEGRAASAAGFHQLARLNPNATTVTKAVDQYGNVAGEKNAEGRVMDTLFGPDGETPLGPDVVTKGIKPSFSEDRKRHIGVQEILNENKEFQKLPGPVKIALGLVGDIAVDPLTYIAPEKAIAEMGGKAGIARKLAELGHVDAAAKVQRLGISAATREELKAVGIRGGLYFNVPGTGHVVNRAADVFGKSVALKQIRILEHGGIATHGLQGLQRVTGAVRDRSAVLQFLSKHMAGKRAVLKADLRSGDPERAIAAMHGLDALNAGAAKGAGFEALKGSQIKGLIDDAEKRGLSMHDLTEAVAGDPEALARAEAKGVDISKHRAWWDSIRTEANATAGEDFIAQADNYVARIRSEAARAELGGSRTVSAGTHQRASFEFSRLKPGEDWMGYKLVEPGAVDDAGKAASSVEKQIADINVKVFGDQAIPLYERDYRKVVGAYLSGIGKRTGEKYGERLLQEKGVIVDRFSEMRPSKRFVKKASKAQKLAVEAEDLAGQEQVAAAELARAQRLLDTHLQNAGDEVTAAGREARSQAETLQRGVDEAQAAQEAIHARVAERLGIVQEARSRVSTVIGENNHPYERYAELLDAREGMQQRIDRLNDAIDDGSALAKEKAANPSLRGEVNKRMKALQEEITRLEGHPVVDSHLEVEALQQQLEDLQLARKSGQEVRAEMHDLNRTMNDLNTKLDKLSAHPRVVAGLREGMDLAEAKAATLRRLSAELEGVTDPAAKREIGARLWQELHPDSDVAPTEAYMDAAHVQPEIDKLDVQSELHRRELTRLGEDPDIVPPRELAAIEHDINFVRESYTTAQDRAREWKAAKTRANLYANTANHADAVEAAEQIRRLKKATTFSSVEEVQQHADTLSGYLRDLQKEHYARRAYEGQILPEHLAGTSEQINQQIHRVQKAREALGVEWNIYDERLAHMEHGVAALKANGDGVFEHADRPSTMSGNEVPDTQKTLWYHYTGADDVQFHADPTPHGQMNTWGGMHAADNPLSSHNMGDNRIAFELHSDKVKRYGQDPMGIGDPAYPHPQTEVTSEGGNFGDVYGVSNSLAEAEQQADMWKAAWDREIITPKLMAERESQYARQWNDVAKVLEENPDADVVDAMAHVFGGGEADAFDPDMLGADAMDGSHPLSPAYSKLHESAYALPTDLKQQVRKAYRDQMRSEGYDAVVYWNETENLLPESGGGAHWSIIVTNPSAARIVEAEGREGFVAMDYARYSDYIEFRAHTGVDRQLLHDTELALNDAKGIANQAEAAWTDSVELTQANAERLRAIEDQVALELQPLTERARHLAADEYNMREQMAAALKRAESEEVKAAGPMVEQTMKLEAARLNAEAKLAQLGHARLEAQNLAHVALGKAAGSFAEHAVDALHDGMRSWGQGKMVPEHIADALEDLEKVVTPEGMTKFLGYHDKALGLWKAYAIASPGFHFRNFFGGQFNMYLQGVDIGVQRRFGKAYFQFSHAFEKSLDVEEALSHVKDVKYRDVFRDVHSSGIMGQGGQIAHEIVHGIADKGNLNPLSTNFKPLRFSARRGEQLENLMRGASAADVLLKGGTMDDAIAAVYKYHFNYEDLSKFERGFAKRVIPFYTWTRKNFTLQIEQLIRQPVKYKRYLDVKRNVEFGTKETGASVPDYFEKGLGIRLPGWAKAGGQSSYLLPDIPFKSLAMGSPQEFVSSASPFVKTPVELWAGKQFFAGLPISAEKTIAPKAWQAIPGLMQGLKVLGKAQKDKNGRWIMSGKDAYLVEQFVPPLARARRLAPNEAKYTQRRTTTALSFAFGVGVRTNTIQGQYSELRRRDRSLSSVIADLQQRGYLEKKVSDTRS